jgi:hypothetical protein
MHPVAPSSPLSRVRTPAIPGRLLAVATTVAALKPRETLFDIAKTQSTGLRFHGGCHTTSIPTYSPLFFFYIQLAVVVAVGVAVVLVCWFTCTNQNCLSCLELQHHPINSSHTLPVDCFVKPMK